MQNNGLINAVNFAISIHYLRKNINHTQHLHEAGKNQGTAYFVQFQPTLECYSFDLCAICPHII